MEGVYTCSYNQCRYASSSYRRYITHIWDKHSLNATFWHECSISGCKRKYTSKQSFIRHIKKQHNWHYDLHYPSSVCAGEDRSEDMDISSDNTTNEIEENENDLFDMSSEKAKEIAADILLELRENYNCTTKATCFIAEKIAQILEIDRKILKQQISESMKHKMPGTLLDYETAAILQSPSVFHQPFNDFKGEKCLSRYIERKLTYVKPLPIEVTNEESSEKGIVQYVPILKTLEVLLEHGDMLEMVTEMSQSDDEYMKNYCDGAVYATNDLFCKEPLALQIILYHDDFGVVNPLGNKTVKHKMSAFYFQLGNLHMKYRSKLSDIQLLMIFPAKMMNIFGYASLLKPLIDDLHLLEMNGIDVFLSHQSFKFYGTVTMVIADNLAAHALSGHYCNFSTVKRFCRFCLQTKDNINNTVINDFQIRTKAGHIMQIADIAVNKDLMPIYGITSECCLNELKYFHSTDGFPPDFAHDMLEGFCRDITRLVVLELISDKFFTLDTLNEKISQFPYSECDKKNPPQKFKIPSPIQNLKFKYTASEMWNFVRLLPLFIGGFIPEGNTTWDLYLKFLVIMERLTANSFSLADIGYLAFLLEAFFSDFLEAYPDSNLKPKGHFLLHYPLQIKKYGPLVKTLRFESKNGILKEKVHLTKNKKNIPYTLSKRHQMSMYLLYKKENITDRGEPEYISSEDVDFDSLNPAARDCFYRLGINTDNLSKVLSAKAVIVGGHRYCQEEAVILGYLPNDYEFGLIEKLFHIRNEVYLLTRALNYVFNDHYHAYEIIGIYNSFKLTEVSKLLDHHPLGVYYTDNKLLLTLKYYVKENFEQ